MEIIPGQGTDAIPFGMSRQELTQKLGEPDNVTFLGDTPGYPKDRECLSFGSIDVLVTPGTGVISISIDSAQSETVLWRQRVFRLTIDQLIQLIRANSHEVEIGDKDGSGYFEIAVPDQGLILYCSEGKLDCIEVIIPGWKKP